MKQPRSVVITKDKVSGVIGALSELVGKQVLVGIPEQNATRTGEEDDGPITNAAIGYLMEMGSPASNVPARPFLIPGVRKSEADVLPHLRAACVAALDTDRGRSNKELAAAGLVAEMSVKREISSNIPPPLKPSTIASRKYARGTASRRGSETQYLGLVKGGMDPGAAQSAAGIASLVNTGQLRNAITSVVRKLKGG